MIKINLLPESKMSRRKKIFTKISYSLILTIVGYVVTIVMIQFFWISLSQSVEDLENQHKLKENELTRVKKAVEEVKDVEKLKETLNAKIDLINNLRKRQMLPVHLLDEVSKNLPDKVWIISLREQDMGNVQIEGKATSNTDIVEYIKRLRNSIYFSRIKLLESIQGSEANVPVYTFKLQFKVGMP